MDILAIPNASAMAERRQVVKSANLRAAEELRDVRLQGAGRPRGVTDRTEEHLKRRYAELSE